MKQVIYVVALYVVLIMAPLLTACGKIGFNLPDGESADYGSAVDILVIGDSISLGYTPHIDGAVHAQGNSMSTVHTKKHLASWLRPANLIIWNNGIWDIKLKNPALYEANLRWIAGRLSGRNVVFITTSYVPLNDPVVDGSLLDQYNQTAKDVMGEYGIPVIDITAFTHDLYLNGYQNPADVHFNEPGYQLLANFIESNL